MGRIHVHLDDELLAQLDELAGQRQRSAFIEEAVRQRVDRERRWRLVRSAVGSIDDQGHPWDPDPASYIHEARQADTARRRERIEEARRRGP